MKKQIIVLILFIIYLSGRSQNSIKTNVPCTDEMAQNAKGRWIKSVDLGTINSKEAFNRLDEIHSLFLKIYPQPTGVDAVWHRAAGMSYFGSKRNYYKMKDDRPTFDYSNLPHFIKYYYTAGFFRYSCEYNKTHSLIPGYPGETGSWLSVTANEIDGAISGIADDAWTINGLPVRMKFPVLRNIRGFEVQYPEPGSSGRMLLIHRNGILPYLPVSRKQYLEQCIAFHSKIWNEATKAIEQIPVRSMEDQEKEKNATLAKFEKDFGKDPKRLKSAVDYYLSGYKTDQQIRDEQIANSKMHKERELKKFIDELENTTTRGLLDSPAMILQMYLADPVFESDSLKANMVVIENPDYIRKDLPKHVPQVFVITWRCNDWSGQKKVCDIIEQGFPIEKLQAMIDK